MKKIISVLLAGFVFSSIAQGVPLSELKSKYRHVREEVKEKERLLREITSQHTSILKELKRLNLNLEKYKTKRRKLKEEIQRLSLSIRKVEREISVIEKSIEKQREWLKRKVQAMQVSRGHINSAMLDPLRLILSVEDMAQAVRRWYYFKALARYDYEIMRQYIENIKNLRAQKDKKESLLLAYNREKEKLLQIERSLKRKKEKKVQFLASLQRKERLYKQMVAELRRTERKIYEMIKEAERKGSSLKGFRKMKRRLPWPVNGRIVLPFGSYIDPKFKTRVFRNGVYIKASEDSQVRVVYDGVVIFADWIEGYGRVIIVKHGEGYYTVYGGLNEIFVKKGDVLNRGDPIGTVGESGVLNEPALYFEVRYRGKPLNPIYWLSLKRG